MRAFLILIFDLILITAKLLRRGGRSSLAAEHLLLRQQLIALGRKRKKAPRLSFFDRVVFALNSLFISSKRLPKLSIIVAHSTILGFHRALVNRKYSKLFSNKHPKKPGPKGHHWTLLSSLLKLKPCQRPLGRTHSLSESSAQFVESTSIIPCSRMSEISI